MGLPANRTLILAMAVLLGGCGIGGGAGTPASSPAPARPAAASGLPTPSSAASAPASASPGPDASGTAVATATASGEPVLDVDDGATTGDGGPLPSIAALIDPLAPAAGRLPGEPDPALTPGALNPAVTQATIGTTICVSGWTATIRPPSSYTTALKIQQIGLYGYTDTSTAAYEEDHLISLELGGAPRDPQNLWPEPYAATLPDGRNVGARVKDALETSLKKKVCAGTVTLATAQADIGIHWVHVYYGIPLATGVTIPSTAPSAAPSPTAGSTTAPTLGSLAVTITSLTDPAIPGSTARMTAATTPGAVCTAKVTWPSGTVSAAAGLKPRPTAGSDGLVSWTWNVGSATKPGTAKAVVTCTLGGSATSSATFAVQ